MKKSIALFLIIILTFTFYKDVYANTSADYILSTVTEPTIGSVGGEWTVIGLARGNYNVPQQYFEKYYDALKNIITSSGGVLHKRKHTEYSRVILALTAIGKNPANVCGFNLLTPLADFEKTTFQGINGAIWALIALDSGNYEIPQNPSAAVPATRDMYIKYILDRQNQNGGFSLTSGSDSDIDITAMVLQAFSRYSYRSDVAKSIDNALLFLSENTNNFTSCENYVQVIIGLTALNIPQDDPRFFKDGKTFSDRLSVFLLNDGSFKHTLDDSKGNLMTTEQALCALAAVKRARDGKSFLYDMTDVVSGLNDAHVNFGLADKHPDIKKTETNSFEKSFSDIINHKYKTYIEELALRNIISGKSHNVFAPNDTMTRAEFATITIRGLGLKPNSTEPFEDVTETDWFAEYVGSAYSYGIIAGVSDTIFNPHGIITRQEAAVMVTRAASLCGMNIIASQDLADYSSADNWAKDSLAFCYEHKILPDAGSAVSPYAPVTRSEIAVMLYRVLELSKLL